MSVRFYTGPLIFCAPWNFQIGNAKVLKKKKNLGLPNVFCPFFGLLEFLFTELRHLFVTDFCICV